MKSEIRNSKLEGNPKSEGGNSKLETPIHFMRVRSTSPESNFGFRSSFEFRPSNFGFTLIELLIVIAIIAILAAMIIPVTGAVNRTKIRSKARGELERVATAIDMYKAKLGHYPPDNPGRPQVNQLFFELVGTTFTNGTYVTLDGSAQVDASALSTVFYGGVGGFVNTTRTGAGDESRPATMFLNNLKPDESITITTPPPSRIKFLVAAVPSPIGQYNYISYVSSNPTNNPNSYDLWVDVVISGRTNRISNWTTAAVVLP